MHTRTLLQHFGPTEAVFKSSVFALEKIEGIGKIRPRSIKSFRDFGLAIKDIDFLQRYGIRALPISDADYRQRLLTAYDAPILLFYKGNAEFNPKLSVSIVGTRRNSDYENSRRKKSFLIYRPMT